MKYIVLLGRILFSYIFIESSFGHFQQGTIDYAAGHGVPLASIAVPLSGVIALLGGLSVLLGVKAKWGGWLLVLFLVPVTLSMHNFWAADASHMMMQKINFIKNMTMVGGALLIACFGAGPASVDDLLKKKQAGAGGQAAAG
jgi:putative oxidoreductase